MIVKYEGVGPLTIAIVGDLHINSTVGLFPPSFTLDDGVPVGQSPLQEKIWTCWLDFWSRVQQEAIEHSSNAIVGVLNGDIFDGDHHHTPQIVTTNMTDQLKMGLKVLQPAMPIVDQWFCVRGTEAHAGLAAQDEEALAMSIGAVQDSDGRFSRWYLRAVFSGVQFDIAHHSSLGRLPWTKPNLLVRLSNEIQLEYSSLDLPFPKYAVRSHHHQWGESGAINAPVHVISIPGWEGITSHVHRLKPGCNPHIGGIIFHVDNGSSSYSPINYSKEMSWIT